MAQPEEFHAKTLKGFETLLAEELINLGAERTEIGNRGVTFFGGRALMYRANLASRLSIRVLLPILLRSKPAGSIKDVATRPPRLMTHAFSDAVAPIPDRNNGKSGVIN